MRASRTTTVMTLVAVVPLAALLVVVGRASVDTAGAAHTAYSNGHDEGYLAGLEAGQAQGRREGRALQVGQDAGRTSRKPAEAAFQDGYAAGANDAFAGYDGGWSTSAPYVVTLVPGSAGITYRIGERVQLQPRTAYFLCPDTRLVCHSAR